MITPHVSWCNNPAFALGKRTLSQEAASMVRYFDECVRRNLPNICYQGDNETAYLPATVSIFATKTRICLQKPGLTISFSSVEQ
jgi:hypothetical protein